MEASQRDQRFLLDMEAFTALESIDLEEEDEREMIRIQFFAETETCLMSLSAGIVQSLEVEREMELQTITATEKMSRFELLRVLELWRYGCDGTAIRDAQTVHGSVMVLLHEDPPPPPDESWRNLPQLLEVERGPIDVHRPSLAVDSMCEKLGSQWERQHTRLASQEHEARSKVEADEQQRVQHLFNSFVKVRDGLYQIEQTIEADVRLIQMRRLPPEQREEFLLGPCRAQAATARSIVEITEDATRSLFSLGMNSLIIGLQLLEQCEVAAVTVQADRTQRCLDLLHLRRFQTHGMDVFQRWKAGAARFRKRRTVYPRALKVLRLKTVRALMHRYARTWFDVLLQPKRDYAMAQLMDDMVIQTIALQTSELEERDRVILLMEEMHQWEELLEEFFKERDVKQRQLRKQQAELLMLQNEARRRLSLLSIWFRFARGGRDNKRAEYLRRQNENRHRLRVLQQWSGALPILRQFGPVFRTLKQVALRTMSMESVELSQQHARLLCIMEEDLAVAQLQLQAEQEQSSICEKALSVQFERMKRKNQLQLMAMRWKTFLSWTVLRHRKIGVAYLQRNSTVKLLQLRWTCWYRQTIAAKATRASLCSAQRQCHERLLIEEEADICRLQVETAADRLLRKMKSKCTSFSDTVTLDTIVNNLLAKHRRPVFFAWRRLVRTHRQQNRNVTHAVEVMCQGSQHTLTAFYWHLWGAVVKQRRSTDVVAANEADSRRCILEEESQNRNSMLLKEQRRSQQVPGIAALLQGVQLALLTARWKRWLRFCNRRRGAAVVEAREPLACCRRVMWLWSRFVKHRKAMPILASIAANTDRSVMKKYFKRMMPAAVRLIKVSKAKASLDRAQAAAKVLQDRGFAASSPEASAATPRLLPPLKR